MSRNESLIAISIANTPNNVVNLIIGFNATELAFRGNSRRPGRSFEDRGGESRSHADSDKDEQLRQQALDSAKEVRRWGEAVTLPQMNSHDRRIIHITLENEADLVTESVGEGNFKSVVISLKKES